MKSNQPQTRLLLIFLGLLFAYGFWATFKTWFKGGLFPLGSIHTPTDGIQVVWGIYGLWGMLCAVCLIGASYLYLPERDWDQWYAKKRTQVLAGFGATVFLVGLILRFVVLQKTPLTDDESSYLLTAFALRSGHLTLPSPDFPEFFYRFAMVDNGHAVFSSYFYGWPILLALAQAMHLEDVANPFFAGLSVIPLSLLLGRYCRAPALLGGLICYSTSLLLLFSSATLLSYTSSLFFLLCFVHLSLVLAEDAPTGKSIALFAATVGATAFFIRPHATLALCLWPGIYMLWQLWRRDRGQLAIFISSAAVFASIFLLMNHAVYGEYFTTGYQQDWKLQEAAGTAIKRSESTEPALMQLLAHLTVVAIRWVPDLLGFPSVVMAVAVIALSVRRLWPLSLGAASATAINIYIADTGIDTFGPTHLIEGSGVLIVLFAAGMQRLGDAINLYCRTGSVDSSRLIIAVFLGVSLAAWTTYSAVRTLGVGIMASNITAPLKLAESLPHPALIFSSRPFIHQVPIWPLQHFVFFIPANIPLQQNKVLWANDLAKKNADLIRSMPDRIPYRLGWRENGQPVLVPLENASSPSVGFPSP